MRRMWSRRAVAVLVFGLLVAGGWAAFHWTSLQSRYAERRLLHSTTEEERARWADALAANGDDGMNRLLNLLTIGESAVRAAAATALVRHLNSRPENDPQATALGGRLLDSFANCDEQGRDAILTMLPDILNRTGAVHSARCKS